MLVNKDVALDRARICASCDRLIKTTFTCKECLCFMKVKVKLEYASCPLHKWGPVFPESTIVPDINDRPEANIPSEEQ